MRFFVLCARARASFIYQVANKRLTRRAEEDVETLISAVADNKYAVKRWRQVSLLVIDEVSMMDAQLFDKLDAIGRALRNSTAPFGGMQLVLCGDFFQLPPVAVGSGAEAKVRFCFQTPTWTRAVDDTVLLSQVFRQKDPGLAGFLNQARVGNVTAELEALLKSLAPRPSANVEIQPTRLFARNADADRVNADCLRALQTQQSLRTYKAKDWMVAERFRAVLEACPAPAELQLAVGAQVVLVKNMRDDSGLVNGSRGVVVGFAAGMALENNVCTRLLFLRCRANG